jgi:hypothetical protein
MVRFPVAVVLVLGGCAKPAARPSTGNGAATVTIPTAPRTDGGTHAAELAASSLTKNDDPLSLEPRADVELASAECASTCRGSVGAAVERELVDRAKKTRACYNRALAEDPALQGRLLVEMRIARSGAVCGAKLLKNELLTSSVSGCVVHVLRNPSYSAPEGGDCVTVNIPIAFVPAPDAGTTP